MEMDSLSRFGYFIDDLSFEYSFDANEGTILYMDGTTSRSALAFSASSVILNYYSGEMFWCPQATIGCDDANGSPIRLNTIFEVKAGLPAHTAFIHCKGVMGSMW
ncbi:hypothetical protein OIU78_026317 [Salix suchowensis]|nr:hypothetical protein OIU78_026317 [Salix suchowensis]